MNLQTATFVLAPGKIESLLRLAREAGNAVMAIYESAGANGLSAGWDSKTDGSPLTQADLDSHRIIVNGLLRIAPDILVVSEEGEYSHATGRESGCFWLVDPLDGTKEFISRNGEFTVNVALVQDGVPVFGVVLAPCLDVLYWGGKNVGAFREQNGIVERIQTSELPKSGKPLRVIASRSHMNADTVHFIDQLGLCELIQAGSSLKFCRIAEGSADVYPRMGPTSEWDTAAGHAILVAAGGRVHRLDGEELRYGKSNILNPHFVAAGVVTAFRAKL